MKITELTTIADVLKGAPAAKKVLDRHGLACTGCLGASAESITRAARNHGIDPKELLREIVEAARAAR